MQQISDTDIQRYPTNNPKINEWYRTLKPTTQRLSYLDKPLEKLYAIMTAESGLRANIPLQLRWRHIQDDFNNRTDSIAIRLEPPFYKGKKKAGYTFIGNRSRALLQYCTEKRLINTH